MVSIISTKNEISKLVAVERLRKKNNKSLTSSFFFFFKYYTQKSILKSEFFLLNIQIFRFFWKGQLFK